ncbi:MAG: hypothetical protein J6N51_17700 [Selenomonas sp.]|nr:hypothetical protein [Selenomonas sp.]
MMDVNLNSPVDVRAAGTKVLIEALGPVGFARFIQQFENGYGDYTKEKYEQPDPSFEELDAELKKYL